MSASTGEDRAFVGGSRFHRLGRLAYRRRWIVLVVWILALVASGPLLGKLTERLSQGGFEVPGSQSDLVKGAVEGDFHAPDLTDLLVLHSDELRATDPGFRSVATEVRTALAHGPGVASVSSPYDSPETSISADGHTAIATVSLRGTQNDALRSADDLNDAVGRAAGGTKVTALLTGSPPFYSAFTKTSTADLKRAEEIALPITLLILILAFGSLVAAGMPLILALLSIGIAMGAISLLAAATTVNIFTQNVASMVGIGVGIDYSLFILTRFRESLRSGRDTEDAVAEAIGTSGKAVFVSALTVVVALSGTSLVNIAAFKSMGWGAMIAVALAAAAALTLLPALLGMLGRRVDAVRLRRRPAGESRMWHRWATLVMRRPWAALAASLVVLGFLAIPAAHLRLGSSGPSILPADASPRVASEIVAGAFGEGAVAPVQIVLNDPAVVTAGGFRQVWDISHRVAKDPEVVGVDSLATLCSPRDCPGQTYAQARNFAASLPLSANAAIRDRYLAKGGHETIISVVTRHGPQSDEAGDFVRRTRLLLPSLLPSGGTAWVGNDAGLNVDINDEVGGKLVPVVALVMVLSYLVLMLFFRSLLLPLKAVLMNTASVLAVYGLLVFVFQEGHLEGLLSFTSPGHIESFLPLFLFCILFGLSMDYEVFLLARIREEYLRTGDNTEAVGWGLEKTASIITSAAAIMVTVFGAFAFASLIPIKSMGFGLAMAVLIDATLVRVVLVPAAMRLMGRWNWWLPRWLDRLLPKVTLEGPESVPELDPQPVAG